MKHKQYYIILQNIIDGNPIAGLFSSSKKAGKYFWELADRYPDNVIELWPATLNKREIGIIHMIDADDE